ncbi:hypothetical protein PIB30_042765 [Stylosanthes scabra]|uniref:Uncharacterized protein n=1 Tax=Stylosanthes scabra TaxID=79078 RepID=A0ABU6WDD8_9FABA|nr:hypothetical protein [Stylosanthes scabra]
MHQSTKISTSNGPNPFRKSAAALREANGANEEPKKFEVFIATRTNRKRKELDEATQHAIVRLISFYLYYAIRELTLIYTYTFVSDQDVFESRQASGETEEEAFQSLFGKEQPGRVRCYGRSITQTDLRKHAEVSAIKQQHQQEVSALQSRLGDIQTQQQQQAEEIHGLRKMVKLLLLRSELEMRPEEADALLQDAQHSPVDANSAHGSTHAPNMGVDPNLRQTKMQRNPTLSMYANSTTLGNTTSDEYRNIIPNAGVTMVNNKGRAKEAMTPMLTSTTGMGKS